MGLPSQHRLKSRADFQAVYQQGSRYYTPNFIVRVLFVEPQSQNQVIPSKIGISIGRKVSKKAVVRNRFKRLIRAVLIGFLPEIAPNYLIVINVKTTAQQCNYEHFLQELKEILLKVGIINGN